MTKKVFLIAVLIISLLLIGLMLLVAGMRSNSILDDFSKIEQEFKNTESSLEEDLKQEELKTSIEKYPEIIQKYQKASEELLQHIKALKEDYIADSGNYEEMDAHKNDILFSNNSNVYAEKGKQFIAKIETYENILAIVHIEFPKTKTSSSKLRNTSNNEDWLVYNFKDFPAIANYTRLTAMEATIKTKQKAIALLFVK